MPIPYKRGMPLVYGGFGLPALQNIVDSSCVAGFIAPYSNLKRTEPSLISVTGILLSLHGKRMHTDIQVAPELQ